MRKGDRIERTPLRLWLLMTGRRPLARGGLHQSLRYDEELILLACRPEVSLMQHPETVAAANRIGIGVGWLDAEDLRFVARFK
jgi:hypothetical protein